MDDPWILVVEDDPDDERLARRVFDRAGRKEQLIVARDGVEALSILRAEETSPRVVLLDLKLPRLSGIDVLMEIREDFRLKTLPVVVLTSSGETTDLAACYELGCNAFVRKPIEFDRYVDVVVQTLGFWLDVNSVPPLKESYEAMAGSHPFLSQ
jgi:two-component system response regulator